MFPIDSLTEAHKIVIENRNVILFFVTHTNDSNDYDVHQAVHELNESILLSPNK